MPNPETFQQVFRILLGLTYIGVGVYLFIAKPIPYPPWSEILAMLFVAYGMWRVYRGFRSE